MFQNFHHVKAMFRGLHFFLKHGWKYDPKYVLWKAFARLTGGFTPLVAALASKSIMDELTGRQSEEKLLVFAGALVGYTLLTSLLSNYFGWDGFTRRCRVESAFYRDLYRRLTRADLERLESPDFLDLKEKSTKFISCDWHGFGYLLDLSMEAAGELVTLAGVSALIFSLNRWMAALFIALTGLGAWAQNRAQKQAMDLSRQVAGHQRYHEYYVNLFENPVAGQEIRLNGMGDWLVEKHARHTAQLNDNMERRNNRFIQANALKAGTTFLQEGAAYAYLIGQVLSGRISVGGFTMYLSAATAFSAALRSLLASLSEISAYDGYYQDLEDYLHLPDNLRKSGRRPVPQGSVEIRFDHVSFRYPGQQGWALRDVCLNLSAGERLAVVGENGAGKTTFVKLLCRLYDPTEGRILVNGIDLRELEYDSYLALFGTVFQNYQLFSMTIGENVALALPLDRERAERCLRQVGLGPRLDSLPLGIDTPVTRLFSQEGFLPSGGEGQKIALARALYRDGPVMVLDEPTAALDPRGEYEIYRQFHQLTAGKSAMYISHRLSSTRFCHRIAVFPQGRLVEMGSHDQLMERGGQYAQLFGLQAQYYVGQEPRPAAFGQ